MHCQIVNLLCLPAEAQQTELLKLSSCQLVTTLQAINWLEQDGDGHQYGFDVIRQLARIILQDRNIHIGA